VNALTAHYSKPKLLLFELGALAFVAAGLLLLTRPDPPLRYVLGGSAATMFFGVCATIIARRLFETRPVLVIDREGIFDRRAIDRVLPWHSITTISEARIRHQRFYFVQPSHPLREFISQPLKRWLIGLNRPWAGRGFFVSASGLNVSHEQIGEAIMRLRLRE
jgi:hypothetical protein